MINLSRKLPLATATNMPNPTSVTECDTVITVGSHQGGGRSAVRRRELQRPVSRTGVGAVRLLGVSLLLVLAQFFPVALAVPTATRSYGASSELLANPDRGFYKYTETRYRADGSGYLPLDAAQLARWRNENLITLVYRVFYLEKFVGQDAIDAAYLDLVRKDFAAARTAGVKLVVRFAYSDTSSADAPLPRVLGHVRQLGPVLSAAVDVIAVLQAGFIGRWGEWYYTDNFAHDPSQPWNLNDADWSARGRALSALLDATAPGIPVQVRYPEIKQRLLGTGTDPAAARVGIHNDCFLASPEDFGTFRVDFDRQWLAEQTRTVPMGGETCMVNTPRSLWPAASADLTKYHWTFLNSDFNTDVLSSWGPDALGEASRRLGYRLRLVQSITPTEARVGERVPVSLTIANDGYAAPFRDRPVQLVMKSEQSTVRVALPIDVQDYTPGAAVCRTVWVNAPAVPGGYSLYLAFPDPALSLARRPAYSIRLANPGLWSPTTGLNTLQQHLRVNP